MSEAWFTRVLKAAWRARKEQGQDFVIERLKAPQGVVETRREIQKRPRVCLHQGAFVANR